MRQKHFRRSISITANVENIALPSQCDNRGGEDGGRLLLLFLYTILIKSYTTVAMNINVPIKNDVDYYIKVQKMSRNSTLNGSIRFRCITRLSLLFTNVLYLLYDPINSLSTSLKIYFGAELEASQGLEKYSGNLIGSVPKLLLYKYEYV